MEDDPFDFESDSLLATSPVVAPKRRKKVIGLDDLLVDHYKEKNRVIERESKLAKTKIICTSDDEEDGRVAKLSKYVNECHEKMTQLSDEDDVSIWGLQVFGNQKALPSFVFSDLPSCSIYRSFVSNEVNSLVELSTESGETFFEGLLTNGWLLKLVCKCGKVETSIAKWTFHLMLYSSQELLRSAAVEFWCAILLLKNEGESLPLKIDWLPSHLELVGALETYGFLLHSPMKDYSDAEMVNEDSECMGPPQSIRAWIKFVAACSQTRPNELKGLKLENLLKCTNNTNVHVIFSTSEAEELVIVTLCLLLDRRLLGLSVDLNACVQSLVSFFTDEEWSSRCAKIAKSFALRVPMDINSLRAVECIPAVCGHTKHLRSAIAFQILLCYFDKVEDEEEVIRQLTLINLKDKSCDLFKMYLYLVLTENWFLYNPALKDRPLLNEMWGLYLRNCSCQINITDTRSYASKVRSKASYLLQGISHKLL